MSKLKVKNIMKYKFKFFSFMLFASFITFSSLNAESSENSNENKKEENSSKNSSTEKSSPEEILEKSRKNSRMTYYFIEYGRGASSKTVADLEIKYKDTELHFHNLAMMPEEYTWAESNTKVFGKISEGAPLSEIISSMTEPYYSIRFHRFFPEAPQFGLGFSHTHFKVYFKDYAQKVRVSGKLNGNYIDRYDYPYRYISSYSLSHGVNHLTFDATYRIMLFPTPEIPDGRLQPYISGSIGLAAPHVEINYIENGYVEASAYEYQPSIKNPAFGLSVGTRFKIINNLGIYLEVKTTYSYIRGMHITGEDGTTGDMKTSFLANHIQFGAFAAF